MTTPLIRYVGKRTEVTDPTTGKKMKKGHIFACRKDPAIYPDLQAINELLGMALIRHHDIPPADNVAVELFDIFNTYVGEEEWAQWLLDQQHNQNGGDWYIDHYRYKNDDAVNDLGIATSDTIDIVIEKDPTAEMFKLRFAGQ